MESRSYQRAASWIDRFASRLQQHSIDREEAIELAAAVWSQEGDSTSPELAAESMFSETDWPDIVPLGKPMVPGTGPR